jgi:hypothetical protein
VVGYERLGDRVGGSARAPQRRALDGDVFLRSDVVDDARAVVAPRLRPDRGAAERPAFSVDYVDGDFLRLEDLAREQRRGGLAVDERIES